MISSKPPFTVPNGVKVEPGVWKECEIPPYSDGEQRHWPGKPTYRPGNDVAYRMKLATALMVRQGRAEPLVNYYIKELPHGYGIFETDQPGGPQVYKRLFGHPSGRYYDSMARFQSHFLWLMSGMLGDCDCVHCLRKKPVIPRPRERSNVVAVTNRPRRTREAEGQVDNGSTRSNSASGLAPRREKRQPKPPGSAYALDAEGTEDVWKDAIYKLYKNRDSTRGTEIDISEENSFDWRAERQSLPVHLTQIHQQHSFIPRLGELVLWCTFFPHEHFLMHDTKNNEYKFYSFDQQCFHGFPDWRGGVVTQVPTTLHGDYAIDFPDILDTPSKETSLNTSGFRIETMPDTNGYDKSMSKQYKYVSLRHIRPLSQWQMLMRGIPDKRWHASIKHALTCTTSVSLLGKWRMNGEWPNASIRCKGVFLGPELITIGDAIRISPSQRLHSTSSDLGSKSSCSDILVVTDIRLNLENVKEEQVAPESAYLASQTRISLVGKAYTLDPRRDYRMPLPEKLETISSVTIPPAMSQETVKSLFRPVGTGDYGDWFPLHPTNDIDIRNTRYEVSQDRVLGRLHESDAVRLWTGLSQVKDLHNTRKAKPSLSYDLGAILSARQYATATDERLPNPAYPGQILWYWTDTRAESLALETINGVEVGAYHDVRDKATLGTWRAQLKIIDGAPVADYEKEAMLTMGSRGRKAGSRVVWENGVRRVILPNEEVGSGVEQEPSQRLKSLGSSQMAGAALVSTDDEEGEDDSDEGPAPAPIRPQSSVRASSQGPISKEEFIRARTKAEIMTSIEDNEEFDDDVPNEDEDEFAFLDDPVPIRGGTEESEGGDYEPKVD